MSDASTKQNEQGWTHGVANPVLFFTHEMLRATLSKVKAVKTFDQEVLLPKVVMEKVRYARHLDAISVLMKTPNQLLANLGVPDELQMPQKPGVFSAYYLVLPLLFNTRSIPRNDAAAAGALLARAAKALPRFVLQNHFELGDFAYCFGGLITDELVSLSQIGIPDDTDLSTILVHLACDLPPHIDRKLLCNPYLVQNNNFVKFSKIRLTFSYLNGFSQENFPGHISAMNYVSITDHQVFFYGGFILRTDRVNFDSVSGRWIIQKGIELNRDGYILDVVNLKFSKVEFQCKAGEVSDLARLGSHIYACPWSAGVGADLPARMPSPIFTDTPSTKSTPLAARKSPERRLNDLKGMSPKVSPHISTAPLPVLVLAPTATSFTTQTSLTTGANFSGAHSSTPSLAAPGTGLKASSKGVALPKQVRIEPPNLLLPASKTLSHEDLSFTKYFSLRTGEGSGLKMLTVLSKSSRLFHRNHNNAPEKKAPRRHLESKNKSQRRARSGSGTSGHGSTGTLLDRQKLHASTTSSSTHDLMEASTKQAFEDADHPDRPNTVISNVTTVSEMTAVSEAGSDPQPDSSANEQSRPLFPHTATAPASIPLLDLNGNPALDSQKLDGQVSGEPASAKDINDSAPTGEFRLIDGKMGMIPAISPTPVAAPRPQNRLSRFLTSGIMLSAILTLTMYVFGGFIPHEDEEGYVRYHATNDLLRIDIPCEEGTRVKFNNEALVCRVSKSDPDAVWPLPRGYFGGTLVDQITEGASCLFEVNPGVKATPHTSLSSRRNRIAMSQVALTLNSKRLLVHGGVDEYGTTFADLYLFDINTGQWRSLPTYAFDLFGVNKKPIDDEDLTSLQRDTAHSNGPLLDAELRACHHLAMYYRLNEDALVLFFGGFRNDALRHTDKVPYELERFDVSRLCRFPVSVSNPNLLRVPVLDLKTQTWRFMRYYFQIDDTITDKFIRRVSNSWYTDANISNYGGHVSIHNKQISIYHGLFHVTAVKAADQENVEKDLPSGTSLWGAVSRFNFLNL